MSEPQLIGVQEDWAAEDGNLVRCYSQDLPNHYWEGLQWARQEDAQRRCPEVWRVGSVPAVFVEKWLKDGFDIFREDAKAIVRRCRQENLTEFLTTDKRV